MTTPHQSNRWIALVVFISGLSLFILQGCHQSEPTPIATAVPTPTPINSQPQPTNNLSLAVDPSATPLPIPVTTTPIPSAAASVPTATPLPQNSGQLTIGFSVQNRPITANWIGTGLKKVILVGGSESAGSWHTYFQNNSGSYPPDVTLWFIPDYNPDNADPASPINANGVNLALNADSRFANCPGQQPDPETAGPYPFSEPESQALRDFLADAWVIVWLTAETDTILPGGCGQHPLSNTLASLLSESIGRLVANEYPLESGHFEDYLAGEGTASAVLNPKIVETEVISTILSNIDPIAMANTASNPTSYTWIEPKNTTRWQFPPGTFIHPTAVETLGSYIYILDSGMVQQLDRQNPTMPKIILTPDAEVAGVRVIEPIDIAGSGEFLYVLDRAGDVYEYNTTAGTWSLRRYDRPVGETSTHYYVALTAQGDQQLLLESSYHLALSETADQPDFIWPLPEHHQIDLTVDENRAYILSQSPYSQTASLIAYENGARDANFSPNLALHRPRQIEAFDSGLYVLDQAGRRLWQLDASTGQPRTIYQPADGVAWSAFDINQVGGQIMFAAKDSLIFFNGLNDTGQEIAIAGTGQHYLPQINDPAVLESLRGLLMPIGGSDIPQRENQMPGAPRHYRYGVHEGADFYWQAGTAVRAVAPGTVIRAMTDYQLPTQEMFANWSFTVQSLGYTSPEAHDFYRGRQVWIEHEGGLITRYVHLSAIDTMISEGTTVEAGQIIGAVGNTGSPVSLESPNTDAHLHFELWLNDHYLGQFLRPIETREWLAIILNE